MLFRWIIAGLLVLAAIVACALAVGHRAMIHRSVENSQRLDRQFKTVAGAIENFHQSHGRQPNAAELEVILSQTSDGIYEISILLVGFDQCIHGVIEDRDVGSGEYVLAAWRGEWWECYDVANNISTLALNPSEYTILGRIWLDIMMFVSIAVACLVVAIKLCMQRKSKGKIELF